MFGTRTGERARGPAGRRRAIRIVSVYATPWRLPGGEGREAAGAGPGDHLRLGEMEGHFASLATQAPRVLGRAELAVNDLRFGRQRQARPVTGAGLWLFATAPGQIVVALSLDVDRELIDTIDLLEDCYYLAARYGEATIEAAAAALARRYGGDTSGGTAFLPDRHQIVFGPAPPRRVADDVLKRVVYRSAGPYRHEFSPIGYPPELNRDPGTAAAVGPSVSVLCGRREHEENAVFLSVVQAVAGAAWLRDIRAKAYTAVETFRGDGRHAAPRDVRRRRRVLARLSGRLGDLELDLSYGVEACADLGLMTPSLRVAGYHQALYRAMGLVAKAEMVARMLRRLERAVDAELMVIESVERRLDENHRLRWAVAVGFVTIVPVPIGLVFAFFGMNTREIDRERSIWDWDLYLPLYLFTGGVIALGVLLFFASYLYQRASLHRDLTSRTDDPF